MSPLWTKSDLFLAFWFGSFWILSCTATTNLVRWPWRLWQWENESGRQQSKTSLNISPGTKELTGNIFTCCIQLFIPVLLFLFSLARFWIIFWTLIQNTFHVGYSPCFYFQPFSSRVTRFCFIFVCLLVPCIFPVNISKPLFYLTILRTFYFCVMTAG